MTHSETFKISLPPHLSTFIKTFSSKLGLSPEELLSQILLRVLELLYDAYNAAQRRVTDWTALAKDYCAAIASLDQDLAKRVSRALDSFIRFCREKNIDPRTAVEQEERVLSEYRLAMRQKYADSTLTSYMIHIRRFLMYVRKRLEQQT